MLFQAVLLLLFSNVLQSKVITLTDENSHIIHSGEWFIKAYAPWCGACKSIAKSWDELGVWAEETDFNISEIDITLGYSLAHQLLVHRIPTLYHVKDGVFRQYQGGRDVSAWKKFLLEQGSEGIEPMSWYRCPGSPTMIVFGYLISFGEKMTNLQSYLTDELEIPAAVSVVMLIVAPIVLSITFFLFSVWAVHRLWGKPKPPHSIGKQRSKPHTVSQSEEQDELLEKPIDNNETTEPAEKKFQ